MNEIRLIARLKIHPGKFDELEEVVSECIRLTREKDRGTLQYDFYLSEDWSECTVLENYRDSAAVLEHLHHLAPAIEKIMGLGEMTFEVYGNPTPELRAALEDESTRFFPTYRDGTLA